MKVAVVLGTRPEIIKMTPVIEELERRRVDFFILHTGQHYSYNLDRVFFEQLKLPQAKYNLEVGSGSRAEQIVKILIGTVKVLREENPETIHKTIQFAKKLKLDFAQFAITIPFPGTELYELYSDGKRGDVSWENFLYERAGKKVTPVFESDSLSRDDLQYWSRRAYREFYLRPSYLCRRIRQITSLGDLKVNLKGLSMLFDGIKR